MPDALAYVLIVVLALSVVVLGVMFLRASGAEEECAPSAIPAEPLPPPADDSPKLSKLSDEALRLFEEAGASWWSEVWGTKNPEPPYDWAQEGMPRAFVGAGRGRAI
jgi:hypothetical protein